MKAVHLTIAGSFSQALSVGSFRYCVEMIPTDLSRPAGVSTEPTDADTLTRYWSGFQPMSCALRMPIAANLGVAMWKNTSALEDFSFRICESTVGSVTS